VKEPRIRPQRRKFLEEQCEIASVAENVRREAFDRAVTVQKLGGILGADAWNTGVAVGGIAHEREQVGDERRFNAKLFADSGCIANCFAPAIDLDHAYPPRIAPDPCQASRWRLSAPSR